MNYERIRQNLLKARMPKELQGPDFQQLSFNVFLSSDAFGLHGTADAIINARAGSAVLELKAHPGKLSRGAELQLAAYSMLLETTSQAVLNRGYFIQGKPAKIVPIYINDQIRAEVISTTNKIRGTVTNAVIPDSDASAAKCGQCEYLNYCNDRD